MDLDEIYKQYKNAEISSNDMVKILLYFIEYKNAKLNMVRKLIEVYSGQRDKIDEIIDQALEDEI